MSLYSICYNGSVLDFYWKKINKGNYNFYIGDINMGIITKTRKSWSACPSKINTDISLIHGFKTRHFAANYLIMYMGYDLVHNQNLKDRKEFKTRLDVKIEQYKTSKVI